MDLKPHDLIRVNDPADLLTDIPLPCWALSALLHAPFVVVRRAIATKGFVPVGIRGKNRGKRVAAMINYSAITEVITPESLISPEHWKISQLPLGNAIISLQIITTLLTLERLCWGPTGSTGFELATGVKTLTADSDLDLIIRMRKPFTVEQGRILLNKLSNASLVRLDIQLDTSLGGISLKEFVSSPTVLVKTALGPVLVKRNDIWNEILENEVINCEIM